MEAAFHLDSGLLDYAFNPCGHIASNRTVRLEDLDMARIRKGNHDKSGKLKYIEYFKMNSHQ